MLRAVSSVTTGLLLHALRRDAHRKGATRRTWAAGSTAFLSARSADPRCLRYDQPDRGALPVVFDVEIGLDEAGVASPTTGLGAITIRFPN